MFTTKQSKITEFNNVIKKYINKSMLMLLAAILVSSAATAAPFANLSISLENTTSGKVYKSTTDSKGNFTFKELPEGNYNFSCNTGIEILSWSWGESNPTSVGSGSGSGSGKLSVISPRDAASGLPTGKRMHKPFVITKELDKASPMLGRSAKGSTSTDNPTSRTTCVATFTIDGTTISGILSDK